jgi:hypothetical protein
MNIVVFRFVRNRVPAIDPKKMLGRKNWKSSNILFTEILFGLILRAHLTNLSYMEHKPRRVAFYISN